MTSASAKNVFDVGKYETVLRTVETGCCTTQSKLPVPPPKPLLIAMPSEAGEFPLLVFLHGYLLHNSFYSQLIQHIASHGFIVIAPQASLSLSLSLTRTSTIYLIQMLYIDISLSLSPSMLTHLFNPVVLIWVRKELDLWIWCVFVLRFFQPSVGKFSYPVFMIALSVFGKFMFTLEASAPLLGTLSYFVKEGKTCELLSFHFH
jgi:hypothetical protein